MPKIDIWPPVFLNDLKPNKWKAFERRTRTGVSGQDKAKLVDDVDEYLSRGDKQRRITILVAEELIGGDRG